MGNSFASSEDVRYAPLNLCAVPDFPNPMPNREEWEELLLNF